ncbi:MAG: Lrp/AsnC family transcriptional regulator [Planctomycetota bacterium]
MEFVRTIDDVDRQILTILQCDGRTTNADIARQVGMAPSAVLERVRKLEERRIILGYTARLNPAALGQKLLAYIFVRTRVGDWQENTGERLAELPEVQEVHHIAGEDCFLVKVRVADTAALGTLLRDRFNGVDTIGGTQTTIVLGTVKETTALPVPLPTSARSGGEASR